MVQSLETEIQIHQIGFIPDSSHSSLSEYSDNEKKNWRVCFMFMKPKGRVASLEGSGEILAS